MAMTDTPIRDLITKIFRRGVGRAWVLQFLAVTAIGLVADITLMWSAPNRSSGMAAAVLVSGACLASGAMAGFLFGIPRSLSQPEQLPAGSVLVRQNTSRPNTNLEQISDWLTKIVVALGLAELERIPTAYQNLAQYVAQAFPGDQITPSLVSMLMLYFMVVGFLFAYLWTRLYLSVQFNRVDTAATQSPAFLEGLAEALLYQAPPDGYTEALNAAGEYLNEFGDQNWRIWRSVACGHGQAYLGLPAATREDAAGVAIRDKALDAVKRVLALNPGAIEGLRSLWDPHKAAPQENDLVVFYEDAKFREVLG
jgi:hypothetical protein